MEAKDASTVILVRESLNQAFEIFLMHRNREQAFMGGAAVFPGGGVEESDRDITIADVAKGLLPGEAPARLQEEGLAVNAAFGLFVAAVRETFEESGVLLARDGSGRTLSFPDKDSWCRCSAKREEIHSHGLSLNAFAEKEGITYALDLLIPYSRWITPSFEKKRYDTRFFLACMPEGQMAHHDHLELTASAWMTPLSALAAHNAGKIVLMPPTLKTVEELSHYEKAGDLFHAAANRRIYPILPEVFQNQESIGILLPHHPEYSIKPYKQPSLSGESSRITLREGIWVTETR